jgi:hypothetical protein
MQLEIPQDIIDITRECQWELTWYAEFDLSISVDKEGKVMIRDMLGVWSGDRCSEDLHPDEAWSMIRKWWSNEQEMIDAERKKCAIEKNITDLQKELSALHKLAEKKKWFWQK